METLLVASRKGLYVVRGEGTRWAIEAHHFAGEPVSQVLADPRDGAWYAALRMGHFGVKLRKSTDMGATWKEVGAPAFPQKPTQGPMAEDPTPWNVDLIWALTPGGAAEPGVLWAGCMPAGLFRSEDGGQTWALNTPLWEDPRRLGWFGGGIVDANPAPAPLSKPLAKAQNAAYIPCQPFTRAPDEPAFC